MKAALLLSTIFVLAVLDNPTRANLRIVTPRLLEPVDSKFYSSDPFYNINLGSQFQQPNQYSNYYGFNVAPAFAPGGNRRSPFEAYNNDFGISLGANGNYFNTQNNYYPDQTYFGTPQPTYDPVAQTTFGNGFNSLFQTDQFSDPFRRTPFPSRFPLTNGFPSSPSKPNFQTVNQGNGQLRPIEGIFGPGKTGQSQPSINSNSQGSGTGGQFRPIQGIFGPGQPGQFGSQTNPQRPGPQPQLRPIKGIFGPGLPGQFDN